MPKKNQTPANNRRSQISQLRNERTSAWKNIWYVYSPRADADLVLRGGDSALEHFFLLEGDATVAAVEYEPPTVHCVVAGHEIAMRFDCKIRFRNGIYEYRDLRKGVWPEQLTHPTGATMAELRTTVALHQNAKYRLITHADLDQLRQRSANWMRAVACMARVRSHSIETQRSAILARLSARESLTLGSLLAAFPERDEPFVMAAAWKLVQEGVLSANLDELPICIHTLFRLTRSS